MADLVDRVYLEIDGEVVEASKIDPKTTPDGDIVQTMNRRNRGIGHAQGIPAFELSVDLPRDHDLDINWHKMAANRTSFTTVVEYESQGGVTKINTYLDCVIYGVDESATVGDVTTVSLEIKALDMVFS